MSTAQLSKRAAMIEQIAAKEKKKDQAATVEIKVKKNPLLNAQATDKDGNPIQIKLDWNGTRNFYITVNGIMKIFAYQSLEWYLISGVPKETAEYVFYNFDSHF